MSSDDESVRSGDESEGSGEYALELDETWPSLVAAVASLGHEEHRFAFPYSRAMVEMALSDYAGPYGSVSWRRAPFDFVEQKLAFLEYDDEPRPRPKIAERTGTLRRLKTSLFKTSRAFTRTKELLFEADEVVPPSLRTIQKVLTGTRWANAIKAVASRLPRPSAAGEEEEEGEAAPRKMRFRGGGQKFLGVVVFSQLLYTEEEAARRVVEEAAVRAKVDAATADLMQWLTLGAGLERVQQVTVERMDRATDAWRGKRRELRKAAKHLREADEMHKAVQARIKLFEGDADFSLHRLKTAKHAKKALLVAGEELAETQAKVAELEGQIDAACERQKLRLRDMRERTQTALVHLVAEKAKLRLEEAFRRQALRDGVRRPWDGDLGADFIVWTLQRQRQRADEGFDDDDDADLDIQADAHDAELDLNDKDAYDSDIEKVDA